MTLLIVIQDGIYPVYNHRYILLSHCMHARMHARVIFVCTKLTTTPRSFCTTICNFYLYILLVHRTCTSLRDFRKPDRSIKQETEGFDIYKHPLNRYDRFDARKSR